MPTFITKMRAESGYTGNGLFSAPISFTGFGTKAMFPEQACGDWVQTHQWEVQDSQEELCGKLFPYTK